jgi:hypothetical protein
LRLNPLDHLVKVAVDSYYALQVRRVLATKKLTKRVTMPPDQWVAQFQKPAEKRVAIKLLKALTVFSWDDIKQGCLELHAALRKKEPSLKRVMFAYFGKGKSGGVIAYLYRQVNKLYTVPYLKDTLFVDQSELRHQQFSPSKRALAIVDDSLCGGTQMRDYLDAYKPSIKNLKKVYVLTLFATPHGQEKILRSHPDLDLEFISVVKHSPFLSGKLLTQQEKQIYLSMLKRYGKTIPSAKLDKIDKEVLVTFPYNTPGYTSMIFSYAPPSTEKNPTLRGLFEYQYDYSKLKVLQGHSPRTTLASAI